jgi:catechol 2,3-dioxygenase-like lactoylglutathione lyase family enzyme
MAVELNHTIVPCHDNKESATFLADILGLPSPKRWGPFFVVDVANGVSLDFHDVADPEAPISPQHYAFLISEATFDEIFGRVRERGLDYWADPGRSRPGEINHNDGGRGVYFEDPAGNLLEIITRPYGG